MRGHPVHNFSYTLRRSYLAALLLAAALAALGLVVFPSTLHDPANALRGLAGVALALAAYALLALWGAERLERRDARLPRLALAFGLAAAAIYAAEIVAEYIFLPSDNTQWGLVEFGLVFLCYLLAGAAAARQTRRAANGIWVAVGAALISTLVWYIVLLAITYLMKGTPQQTAVLRAEGDFDDFARSGAADFQAWLMEDLWGAGFFHLYFGPIVGGLLGGAGGLVGRLLARR